MNFTVTKRLLYPTNIIVSTPRNIRQLSLTWNNVKNPDVNLSDNVIKIKEVCYNVYRSTSMKGLFYQINKSPIKTNRYDDTSVSLNPNARYWYKVSTLAYFNDGSVTESILSEPVMYQVKNENKWFDKINERNMWILKNTGVLMDLYIRKSEGERCPNCWDDIRGQSSNNSCKVCFGTGIVGGYEPAYQLYVRQKPATQQLDLTTHGYSFNSTPGSWTISSVQIRNRDILINPEGRMFSVTNSHVNHAAGYLFHQELQMKELDPMDERYNIKRGSIYPEF